MSSIIFLGIRGVTKHQKEFIFYYYFMHITHVVLIFVSLNILQLDPFKAGYN